MARARAGEGGLLPVGGRLQRAYLIRWRAYVHAAPASSTPPPDLSPVPRWPSVPWFRSPRRSPQSRLCYAPWPPMLGAKDVDVKRFAYRRHIFSSSPSSDGSQFHVYRCPTVASTLWATLRLMPRFLRLKVYQWLMSFGQATSSTRVTRLPCGLYAKHGCNTSVIEALATQYVSVKTTIPVPTILDVLLDSVGTPLILMTRIQGAPLCDMPLTANELSDARLSTFTSTMAEWLAQLRQLGPPPSGLAVCGFMGTPFMSYRIDHSACVGPFSSSDEFHSQYYCTLPPEADPDIRALAKRVREKPYRVCFTHGDISPSNILVDEDYLPVGLVDWGCAAWMPEYWELTSSIYCRQRYAGWVRIFKAALPQYEEELAVEMELWNFVMPW